MKPRIEPIRFSQDLFAPLLSEAPGEGGRFLLRLRDQWVTGELRFDGSGELLLGAFLDDRLVGLGGISQDPYSPAPWLGRVRHLYVLRDKRRSGIGRAIMDRLIDHARGRFALLRLTTDAPEAARLYESLGFVREDAPKQTHRLEL